MNTDSPDFAGFQRNESVRRYPVLATSSVRDWEQVLVEKYGVKALQVPQPDNVWTRAKLFALRDITLGYSAAGPRCTIEYEEADSARLRLVLTSSVETKVGSQRVEGHAGRPTVVSPGEAIVTSYGDDCRFLFLRIDSTAMHRKLTALTGLSPRRKFIFNPVEFTSQPLISGLKMLMESFARQVDDPDALISPIALKELEQAIVVQFLLASRHNFSLFLDREDSKFVPAHVQRAAEYIEASWNTPITIEDLVEVGGVSARTLFKAFANTYGCSPMVFAKKQRLQHARRLLIQGGAPVTEIAVTCGFSNLGHFAADYRKQFGELPSQTLSRRQS